MKMKVTAPFTKDIHISSTSGCSVYVPAGQSKDVPAYMAHLAVAKGAAVQPLDGSQAPAGSEVEQAERQQKLRDAVKAFIDGAEPDDFTANGRPRKQRVQEMVGFSVSAEEVNDVYERIMAS